MNIIYKQSLRSNNYLTNYKYKEAANTISRFISFIASLNLFSSSMFPIPFAAWHSCRSNSSKRRIHLIIDPKRCKLHKE